MKIVRQTDSPDRLLKAARTLLERPDARTAGVWPRGAAHLTRQALELLLDELWRKRAPGTENTSTRAGCLEVTRGRRLTRGESHTEVETLIERNPKLLPRLALALYDDAERASEVLATLNRSYGPWSADVVQACNKGAHGVVPGDGIGFVRDTEKLVNRLLAL